MSDNIMLDNLLLKPIRVRQPSIITGPSIDTMSTITTVTNKKSHRSREKADDNGSGGGGFTADTNSHHSQSSADEESSMVSVKSGITRCCKQGSLGLRRWQMFQMIIFPFIPITALIIQNSTLLTSVVINLQEAWEMKQQINTIVQLGKLLTQLQQERADLGFCIFTNAPDYLRVNRSISKTFNSSTTTTAMKAYNNHSKEMLAVESMSSSMKYSSTSSTPLQTTTTVIVTTITLQSPPLPSTSSATNSIKHSNSALPQPPPWKNHDSGMSIKMRNSLCRTSLSVRFDQTEKVVEDLSLYVSKYVPTVASLRSKREKVFQLTGKNGSVDDTALNELLWYNVANDVILDLLSDQIRKTTTSGVWKVLIAYKNIIRCIENYSISMIYGLYYFGKGKLSQNSFNKYIQFDSLAADYLNATKSFSPEVTVLWDKLIGNKWKTGFLQLAQRRAIIYRNDREETGANDLDAKIYYANMTSYIDELRKFQQHLKIMIDAQVMDEMIAAKVKKFVAAALLALVMLISPIIICLVRNVTTTMQQYSMMLNSKTSDLKREKRKSDRLLQQMLPAEVIRQLRSRKQVPAESFESVTIYFSDIVSFTSISATSSPMEIVVMLNSLYKMFDSRIDNYDVYKVETIGDAYMVVSGLPTRNGNLHASEICTMALDLVAAMRHFEIPHRPGQGLEIRIGINTGCCVAGVVGTKMPRYCLFGDAINVASRMESHGEPMRIHVTETTKVILDELGGFIMEERGVLEIKGKGTMNTYWLEEKVGGIPRSLEMTTPGFFLASPAAHTPEFLREIFGNDDSEEERGDYESIQLNLGQFVSSSSRQQNPEHLPSAFHGTRNPSILTNRHHCCISP